MSDSWALLAVTCQASLSIGFSRQEYWSELPFPSPGNLPNPGIKPRSPALPKVSYQLWDYKGFPGGAEVKASACNVGDLGSIPGSGRAPGEGNGNPLQCSCLENPRNRGAWGAAIYGVAQSRTRLKWLSSSSRVTSLSPSLLHCRLSYQGTHKP